jgi:hypothetical protein
MVTLLSNASRKPLLVLTPGISGTVTLNIFTVYLKLGIEIVTKLGLKVRGGLLHQILTSKKVNKQCWKMDSQFLTKLYA